MTDETDVFTKSITHSKERSEQFTLEVEESAAIKIDSGMDEMIAFREAVMEIFDKWRMVEQGS